MKKPFTIVCWVWLIVVGVLSGVWLAADMDPVNCPKEGKLCSSEKCRKTPHDPNTEECTYLDCKYGRAWRSRFPVRYDCCDSAITHDPRVPWACCDIPIYEVQCRTQNGQTCLKEYLPQDCNLWASPGICPLESDPQSGRRCIGTPRRM